MLLNQSKFVNCISIILLGITMNSQNIFAASGNRQRCADLSGFSTHLKAAVDRVISASEEGDHIQVIGISDQRYQDHTYTGIETYDEIQTQALDAMQTTGTHVRQYLYEKLGVVDLGPSQRVNPSGKNPNFVIIPANRPWVSEILAESPEQIEKRILNSIVEEVEEFISVTASVISAQERTVLIDLFAQNSNSKLDVLIGELDVVPVLRELQLNKNFRFIVLTPLEAEHQRQVALRPAQAMKAPPEKVQYFVNPSFTAIVYEEVNVTIH